MAIKGLKDLLKKVREDSSFTDDDFEKALNEELPKNWIPKDVYNELSEKYKTSSAQNESNAKLMKELQDRANLSDDYKSKIDEMSKNHKSEIENLMKNLARQKKDSAIERILDKAGSLNNKATRALLNDEAITLNDAGEVIGLEEQIKAMKKDNAFLFKAEEPKDDEGTNTPKFLFGGSSNQNQNKGNDTKSLEALFGL